MSVQPFERLTPQPPEDVVSLPDQLGTYTDEYLYYTDREFEAAGACMDGLAADGISLRTQRMIKDAEARTQNMTTESCVDTVRIGQLAIESMMRRANGLPDDTVWNLT